MSLSVASNERGVVRVFALSMTDAEALDLRNNISVDEDTPAPQQTALGADYVDSDFTEVFPVKDLAGLGLSGYLETGNGIDPEQLAPDKAKLDALGGWVFILYSAAFGGIAQTLRPRPALKLIGTYSEPLPDWRADPVAPVQSAKPFTGPAAGHTKPDSTARASRMSRIVVAVLAILVALIWIIVR